MSEPLTPHGTDRLLDILHDDDVLSMDEANRIAEAIDGAEQTQVLEYLRDLLECDGTPHEAKLAAILRGLILARDRDLQ